MTITMVIMRWHQAFSTERTSCGSNDYCWEPENREGGFKVCDVGAAKNITTGMHMDIGC